MSAVVGASGDAEISAVVSVLLLALALGLAWWSPDRPIPLERRRARFSNSFRSRRAEPGVGLSVALASIAASLQSGMTLRSAIMRQIPAHGSIVSITDSAGRLDAGRLREAIAGCAADHDSVRQVAQVAHGLAAAYALSSVLGCRTVDCVEAVRRACLRLKLSEDLTRTAFAVPKATVHMLCALPAVTLLLGELLGANPVWFLVGSMQGLLCLLLGVGSYALGLWWMKLLLDRDGSS